jgi:hypothetical protein
MRRCNTVALKETSDDTIYNEHELTREIIFVFAMSTLSRYKVHKWDELIKGKESDTIWKVQEYLTSTQTIFPNLIFNQLHGKQYYFYPVQPELMVTDTQHTNKYPWNR